ncbi:MAG: hypothetical protein IJE45_01210 [Bacilli bacterium]|nr:hypothetical protein [Bacilli bacterium]
MIEINQLVFLKSDPNKIIYKVKKVVNNNVELTGMYYRSKINVTISDIEIASPDLIQLSKNKNEEFLRKIEKNKIRSKKYLLGRILHIDGDEEYLESCLELYKNIGLKAEGIYIEEKDMPDKIESLLEQLTPDIVVITGHDSFNEKDKSLIDNYENSKVFGETIRIIRKHYLDVVIIAGACCSHFEYLIAQGANFASSPGRINTHTYDPAVTAIKVASTSINKTVDFSEIIKYIEGGKEAIGGIQTNGKMRIIY